MTQKLPPAWLIKGIDAFRKLLLHLNRRLFPGNVVLYEQFQNFWLLPSMYVAARLNIAGLVETGPMSADEIAARLNVHPVNLARLLRGLASQGIFRLTKDGRYTNTSMSRALSDRPGSLRHMILHHLGPVNWNLMSDLLYSVETGQEAFSPRYGTHIYAYLQAHPDEYAIFDRSMSNLSDLSLAPVMHVYDFSKFSTIADIGGGEGFFLAHILSVNNGSAGILFDTEEALVKAPGVLAEAGVAGRTSIVPGDFFQSVPADADLYILKNIIHNWSDEDAVTLLKNINQAMNPGGRVLVIEMVVPGGNRPSISKLLDIQMMVSMQGGLERTAAGFSDLFARAGFSTPRIISTISPICLLEAGRKS